MALFVKICGICSKHDLEQISALNPSAMGFVFWEKSKRAVDPKTVGMWQTPACIKRVGVFVNPTKDELHAVVKAARLDVIQLHKIPSHWTIDRNLFPSIEIWKAGTFEEIRSQSFDFDRFLIDSYDPKTVGGTGKTCDWDEAKQAVTTLKKPLLLAGGLTPQNVEQAIQTVHPNGVDVSSGVEISPGKKDLKKVAAFLTAARAAK